MTHGLDLFEDAKNLLSPVASTFLHIYTFNLDIEKEMLKINFV
jgi:hypothetical protein